jgi:glycosyltransferase involved in cell wall biosynthesis
VALARDEARHLVPCFRSLEPLASRPDTETLIILDSRADQATVEAAHRAARRVEISPFVNFSAQRNKALRVARGEWVFFIDADERGTPALVRELERCVTSGKHAAYRVPRRNIFFGHEVRHTGWWPDYQLRLLKRACVHYDESREVHEVPVVEGSTGTLTEPLIHFNYESWGQFFRKQRRYAAYDAAALHASGRQARLKSIIGQPLREFKRRFIDYEGYKDGLLGLALSLAMAAYSADIYRRLWLLQRRAR